MASLEGLSHFDAKGIRSLAVGGLMAGLPLHCQLCVNLSQFLRVSETSVFSVAEEGSSDSYDAAAS